MNTNKETILKILYGI